VQPAGGATVGSAPMLAMTVTVTVAAGGQLLPAGATGRTGETMVVGTAVGTT
jgi:hypothetical protein